LVAVSSSFGLLCDMATRPAAGHQLDRRPAVA